MTREEKTRLEELLIQNIKNSEAQIRELYQKAELSGIGGFYRFYHQSFKVYDLQKVTEEMVRLFEELLPGRTLNAQFLEIIYAGTYKEFSQPVNLRWSYETRPILEAYSHAKYFLSLMKDVILDENKEIDELHEGYFGIMYLYNLR